MCYVYLLSVGWLRLVCTLWLCVGFCWSSYCVYGRYVGVYGVVVWYGGICVYLGYVGWYMGCFCVGLC